MRIIILSLIVTIASGSLASAASPSIGLVKSNGEFRIDGSSVRANSTLFEGSVIETAQSRSEVVLSGGTQVVLTPESRAKVFRERTLLEKGVSLLKNADRHQIETANLRITPSAKSSVVQVALQGVMRQPGRVVVSSQGGPAEVRTASGILVARVMAGMALSFQPQGGAATQAMVTGTLIEKDGNFYLTDATTRGLVEIRGQELGQYLGKRIEVTGSLIPGVTPAGGASQVVNAVEIKVLGAIIPSGLSGAQKGAIIAGVAVGGAVGGLFAGGVFSSDTTSSVP